MNKLALLLSALLLAPACSSDDDDGDDGVTDDGADDGSADDGSDDGSSTEDPPEVVAFFEDFHASRYSQAAARAAALDAAAEADPSHGRLSFDRALAHTWHVAEWGRDPSQDPAALQAEVMSLLPLFQTAAENNPDDDRVGCFLGLQLIQAGRFIGDDSLVQQGVAVLDQAVAAWPEFNYFCVGLAYDQLPASDPDFALAVDAAYATMDVCYGEAIDRDAPDLGPYLDQVTDQGIKRACWNDPIAPHNVEGFYLWMGDILVKQGRVGAARVAYDNVKLAPEYPDWPYRSLLQERLSADLDAKAALYQDADPANDPPFAGNEANRGCAVCHASSAAE